MRVLPFNKNLFNATGYLGEAPQLSSVYGKYFNALQVFNYAWDFAGTTLPSSWYSNSMNYNVSNGLYISYSPTWSYMHTYLQVVKLNSEILADIQFGSYASGAEGRLAENNITLANDYSIQTFFVYEYDSTYLQTNNATIANREAISVNTNYNIYGLYLNKTKSFLNFDGSVYSVDNTAPYSSSNTFYIGLGGQNPNDYENVSWIVVPSLSSLYMPTYTIGTAQSLTPQYLFNINTILNFMNTVFWRKR